MPILDDKTLLMLWKAKAERRLKTLYLWKRAAKKWRDVAKLRWEKLGEFDNMATEAEATADRHAKRSAARLEIIKDMYGYLRQCPYCGVVWGNFKNHAEDCRLAKELSDAES